MCRPDFEQTVAQAVGEGCCRPGTQALSAHSRSISAHNTRSLVGSVDLDACLKAQYPDASRWDFAVGYGECNLLAFVEVHGAKVSEILKKKQWLDNFLAGRGAALNAWAGQKIFVWAPTQGGFGAHTPQARQLKNKNITTDRRVRLKC